MMAKFVALLIALFLWTGSAFAEEVYVKSIRAKILSKPTMRSMTVATVQRGKALEKLRKSGKWVEVEFKGKKGWISKYLVSKRPPMKRVSLLARSRSLEKSSRRRASAFTSVAAARGLTDYDRARTGRKGLLVDFAALEKMESINISEAEALQFIDKGVSQ